MPLIERGVFAFGHSKSKAVTGKIIIYLSNRILRLGRRNGDWVETDKLSQVPGGHKPIVDIERYYSKNSDSHKNTPE